MGGGVSKCQFKVGINYGINYGVLFFEAFHIKWNNEITMASELYDIHSYCVNNLEGMLCEFSFSENCLNFWSHP